MTSTTTPPRAKLVVAAVALLAAVLSVSPADAFLITATRDLDTGAGYNNLVGDSETIVPDANGLYTWTTPSSGLNLNNFNLFGNDGRSFTLNLAGGNITRGAGATNNSIVTNRSGNTGSITITNAGTIDLLDLKTTPDNNSLAGSISVSQSGSFTGRYINASTRFWQGRPSVSFTNTTGAGGFSADYILTAAFYNTNTGGGDVTISGYQSVYLDGYVKQTNNTGAAGALTTSDGTIVTSGDWGNGANGYSGAVNITNIGAGGVYIKNGTSGWAITTGKYRYSSDAGAPNVTISTLGEVEVGGIRTYTVSQSGVVGSGASGSVSITHVGDATLGPISTAGSTNNGTVTLNGTDQSGVLTGDYIISYNTVAGNVGAVTIRNYYGVNITGNGTLSSYNQGTAANFGANIPNGSIIASTIWGAEAQGDKIVIQDIGAGGVNVGTLTTRSRVASGGGSSMIPGNIVIGDLDGVHTVIGDIHVKSVDTSWSNFNNGGLGVARGNVTMANMDGKITLNELNLDLVGIVKLDAGQYVELVALDGGTLGGLLGFNTAGTGDGLSLKNPVLTTQTQLRLQVGDYFYYDETLAANAYLGGKVYQLADLDGAAGAGGLLAPMSLFVPEPATMAFLVMGGLAMAGGAIRRRRRA